MEWRKCYSLPPAEALDAAERLRQSLNSINAGALIEAERLLLLADDPSISSWADTIMTGYSEDIHGPKPKMFQLPLLNKKDRPKLRMPDTVMRGQIAVRDKHCCRFCGLPTISKSVRVWFHKVLPSAARWGPTRNEQHHALRVMSQQCDHLLPYSRGGTNEMSNLVLTCLPCNYGRGHWTLEESFLLHPLSHGPYNRGWEDLENLLKA